MPGEAEPGLSFDDDVFVRLFNAVFKQGGLLAFTLEWRALGEYDVPAPIHVLPSASFRMKNPGLADAMKGYIQIHFLTKFLIVSFNNGYADTGVKKQSEPIDLSKCAPGKMQAEAVALEWFNELYTSYRRLLGYAC